MSYTKPKTSLKLEKPSSMWGALWREGLPLGNGLTGACVYGGAASETVMLTSALSSWQGNISVLPDISDKVKDVRKLLDDGKYSQAEKVYPDALIGKNYRPQPSVPLPVCDFKINMKTSKPVKEYNRILNMENGEATVSYKEGGTRYERTMFVSRTDDIIVCEITKSGNDLINAEFSFELHDRKYALTSEGIYSKLPEAVMIKCEPYFMYYSARKDNGTEFGAVAKISYYGGSMEIRQNSIFIKGANSVLVIIKLFTESQREKEWKNNKVLLAQNKNAYDKMLREHTKVHSKLFLSSEIDLNAENRELSYEELLRGLYNGEPDQTLIEKLWQYGRYLFISSSRQDGNLLINPYGLWCGEYKAVSSHPCFDGTTQRLYRSALENNLCDNVLPLLNYFETAIYDFRKNAQRLYNCKGIFVPAVISPGTGLLGTVNARDIYFIAGTADTACLFYDYFLFTGDKKFLKERAMPFMKEAAAFYEDFLKTGQDGLYESSPSYSPGGCPGNLYNKETGGTINIAKNSEIDFAAIRRLFKSLIEGVEISGLYKDEKAKWEEMLTKLPLPKTSLNFVREYNSAEFSDNFLIGEGGALYSVYPSCGINTLSGDITKTYLNTVKKRLSEGMNSLKCSTIAYLSTVSARLGDGAAALELINSAAKACLLGNMITVENDWRGMGYTSNDSWAAYQISGNILLNAAINSLFLHSDNKNIFVFPGGILFKSGRIKGFLTMCGCEADMEWNNRYIRITLKARKSCNVNIVLPECSKKIQKGTVLLFDENKVIKDVAIGGGKTVNFDIRI